MILETLTLRNFCLYSGEQAFDLSPRSFRGKPAPIVLFGGINGGGKTTLLDAVQLVLYGIRAKCSKRNDKPYDVFLRESIHNGVDPKEGASIELSFRYATEGKESLYEVRRSWSEVKGRIRERMRINRDGERDGWLSENWNQVVEELIPYGVAQLCFFDAEKIRFLAESENGTEALGGAIKSLLGLDLAERLVADASVLESRVAKRATESDDLVRVRELEGKAEELQERISKLVQEQAAATNPKEQAEDRVAKAQQHFSRVGGKHWEEREKRQEERHRVEQALLLQREKLVSIAATDLPLGLIANQVESLHAQSQREQEALEGEITSKFLSKRDKEVLSKLKRKKLPKDSLTAIEKVLASDRDARNTCKGVEIRHRLSHAARHSLEQFASGCLSERVSEVAELVKTYEDGQKRYEDLQRSMAATPDEEAIKDVAKELSEASKELAKLDHQVQRVTKELEAVRTERRELDSQLAKLRRKVVEEQIGNEEDGRIAQLLVRTQGTMKEFLKRSTEKKIHHLAELIGESFRFLLRKGTLIHKVSIDPESFVITLFDDQANEVPKQRLSEGEKQIFAISVLWGLSRASARPLPAIIDTPMGRLDAKHRNQLVERYFPHASHQVIILSTDTEIEREYFHQLQPHITRGYHLNYEEVGKRTVGEEGYFWSAPETGAKLQEATA